MKYSKQIVVTALILANVSALGFFMKYWDPVREFFKSAPPARQVEQKKPAEKSPKKAILQEAVLKQREKIEVCYDDYLRREPKNSNGSLAVKWTIGSSGQVEDAEVTDNNIKDLDLEECVLQEVVKMTFDPQMFAGNTQFSYRFHFKARAPAAVAFE